MLTASGGPFRGRRRDELAGVTVEQALAHPTWDMGPVVTINSATLVNKGLELIEAHLLFGVPYDRIDVVVHPQSVVHSMVTLRRRVDDRAGQPAGHAAADRARAGLAGPGRRRGAAVHLGRAARPGRSSRSTTTRSPACGWPGRPARPAAACPRCSTRRTRRPSRRSSPGGLGFLDLTAVVADTLAAADGWRADPATVADVAAAEEWARAHAGGVRGAPA